MTQQNRRYFVICGAVFAAAAVGYGLFRYFKSGSPDKGPMPIVIRNPAPSPDHPVVIRGEAADGPKVVVAPKESPSKEVRTKPNPISGEKRHPRLPEHIRLLDRK